MGPQSEFVGRVVAVVGFTPTSLASSLPSRAPSTERVNRMEESDPIDRGNSFATGMFFPPVVSHVPVATVSASSLHVVTFQSAIQSLSMRMTAIEAGTVAQGRILQARIRTLEAELQELRALVRPPSSVAPSPAKPAAPLPTAKNPAATPFYPSKECAAPV